MPDENETPVVVDVSEEEIDSRYQLPFPIVAIGASAGGVEAYISLFERLPADTGMAFVAISHLAADQKSHLVEIIGRHSSMPVGDIGDGMKPQPDRIYVLLPNKRARMARGVFRLEPRNGDGHERQIDSFFRSLAADQKNRAIGVVLSGMDSDGALGLRAIKGEGGIAIVQSPSSAKFPDMPLSSISTDHVDIVLPPGAIASHLAQLGKQFRNPELRKVELDKSAEDDQAFARVLSHVRGVTGVDFRMYKPTTIRRRIARRMLLHRVDSLAAYEALLRSNPREVRDLQEDALISVTRFFRDPDVFDSLKTVVLPNILDGRTSEQARVWVAGCSSGEEVYSIAICMLEYLSGRNNQPPIQIFGTDASQQSIDKARLGIYPETVASDVSPEQLRRFFVKNEKGSYQVSKRVRDLCIFARQNLCIDPPFSRVDLISCRNVLIYFNTELQRRVIPTFHYALRANGFLLLGTAETIRDFTEQFALSDRRSKIFSRIGTTPARSPLDAAPSVNLREAGDEAAPGERAESWGDLELQRAADRIVLARFGPPGVVVNELMEIVQWRGQTSAFFEMPQGSATVQLGRMARMGIAAQVTAGLRRAIQDDSPVQMDRLEIRDGENAGEVAVEIIPIHQGSRRPRCFLVLFAPAVPGTGTPELPAQVSAVATDDEKLRLIAKLQHDLGSTRMYLQSLLEERDAKNQELLSANEEIQSANEELQSTNEELETTKEELQSSNEELQTVNDELQNRNIVLTQASNDLSNLLNSVNLPVLMLNNELTIRHFTPPAQRILNVRTSDLGRPVGEIRLNLQIENIEPLLREVLETLSAREIEVRDRDGRWHLLRVRPYRTVDNKIEGLVVVLVDIDQLRRKEQELREARDFARLVIESIPLPLVVTDLEFRIQTSNDAFSKLSGMPPDAMRKRGLPDLARALWGLDEPLRSGLEKLKAANGSGGPFEFEQQIGGDRPRVLCFRGCAMQTDGQQFLLVTVEDLTAHKEAERTLRTEAVALASEVASSTEQLAHNREDLRMLASDLFRSQEEERSRVARELHDDVSQRLAVLELNAGELENEIGGGSAGAKGSLSRLREGIAQLSRDVRGLSHRLHPAMIEDLGLGPALRSLAEEFQERERMIVNFAEQDLPPRIPPDVAIGLYRITQEALRNVAKHAGRCHVKVTIRGDGSGLQLQVTDSGLGFDMEDKRTGLGFVSMGERVRQLGGTLTIESALGKGTRIAVEAPLGAAEEAEEPAETHA